MAERHPPVPSLPGSETACHRRRGSPLSLIDAHLPLVSGQTRGHKPACEYGAIRTGARTTSQGDFGARFLTGLSLSEHKP